MKTPRKQNAFTLIEVLMSLVILAMLMAAVAIAFDASVNNFNANQGIYETVNTGRQALLRITNDIRTAGGVEIGGVYYPAVALIGASGLNDPDESQLSITNSDTVGLEYTYRYDDTDNTLYLVDNKDAGEYVLCENVTSMTFDRRTVDDGSAIRSVRIVMTITDDLGKVEQTLAAGAVVRRNL